MRSNNFFQLPSGPARDRAEYFSRFYNDRQNFDRLVLEYYTIQLVKLKTIFLKLADHVGPLKEAVLSSKFSSFIQFFHEQNSKYWDDRVGRGIFIPLIVRTLKEALDELKMISENSLELAELTKSLEELLSLAKEDLSTVQPQMLLKNFVNPPPEIKLVNASLNQMLPQIFKNLLDVGGIASVMRAGRTCKKWYSISRGNSLWFPFFKTIHPYSEITELPEGQFYQACLRDIYVVCGFIATKSPPRGFMTMDVPSTLRTAPMEELQWAVKIAPKDVFIYSEGFKSKPSHKDFPKPEYPYSKYYESDQFPAFINEHSAIEYARSLAHDVFDIHSCCYIPVVAKAKSLLPLSNNHTGVDASQIQIYAVKQVNSAKEREFLYIDVPIPSETKSNSSSCVIC